jgi:hypothetical protein
VETVVQAKQQQQALLRRRRLLATTRTASYASVTNSERRPPVNLGQKNGVLEAAGGGASRGEERERRRWSAVTKPSPRGHGWCGVHDSREERSSSPLKEMRGGCSVEIVAMGHWGRRGRALFKGAEPVHRAPGLCTNEGRGGSWGWSSRAVLLLACEVVPRLWKLACVSQRDREERRGGAGGQQLLDEMTGRLGVGVQRRRD